MKKHISYPNSRFALKITSLLTWLVRHFGLMMTYSKSHALSSQLTCTYKTSTHLVEDIICFKIVLQETTQINIATTIHNIIQIIIKTCKNGRPLRLRLVLNTFYSQIYNFILWFYYISFSTLLHFCLQDIRLIINTIFVYYWFRVPAIVPLLALKIEINDIRR